MKSQQDLLLEYYISVQLKLSESGEIVIPKPHPFSTRALALLGALNLSLFIACLVIFLNFIVINLIFHLQL